MDDSTLSTFLSVPARQMQKRRLMFCHKLLLAKTMKPRSLMDRASACDAGGPRFDSNKMFYSSRAMKNIHTDSLECLHICS